MIDTDAVLAVIADILTRELDIDPSTAMTAEMGALVRDKGPERALAAAALRRSFGQFHDLTRCADFALGPHRRRIKR